ncbi:sulfatase-like hydrolase/transferase [Nitrosomonas sp. ANs5]|uniref:sulfatase-like hydrolase/transferase n=1 Tax=Nitrosomonas sp. ANs5 TaxID=3423941 RepID=UPI003D349977
MYSYRNIKPLYLLVIALYGLLAAPVLASFHYGQHNGLAWLLLALAGLACLMACGGWLVAAITRLWQRRLTACIMTGCAALLLMMRFVSFYFQGESFNARFFYHLNTDSLAVSAAYLPLMAASILFLIGCLWLTWRIVDHLPPKPADTDGRNFLRLALPSMLMLMLMLALEPDLARLSAAQWQMLSRQEPAPALDNIDWNRLGLNRAALTPLQGTVTPGKNLVLIYLESLERLYTDEQVFPGLTPNLNQLMQSGLMFNNMQQTEGTDWTVAGMTASLCGTPLLYGLGPGSNDILQGGFLNQATCLPDILKRAGYHQVYMGGAPTEFGGKGTLLSKHGFDQVKGKNQLIPLLTDPSYLSGWGLYDDSLFDLAAQEFERLATLQKPFNLTLLTLDTHHPSGHPSASCPRYLPIDNSILHAVHCTDHLVARFLERIAQHPAWENTVVVLLSDHLAMRNDAQPLYPSDYDRQLLFLALNTPVKSSVADNGTHMDVAPTVLDLLEVQHSAAFLAGNSLLETARPQVDVYAQSRLDAIQYLNLNLLTSTADSICDHAQLFSAQNHKLLISKREVPLSMSGMPLPFESMGTTHGLIALLNDQGVATSAFAVHRRNLAHALYQYRDHPFIVIAPAASLPFQSVDMAANDDEIVAVLGKLGGEQLVLGKAPDLESLHLSNSGCQQALTRVMSSQTDSDNTAYLANLCQPATTASNTVDPVTGTLHLTQLAHEDGLFQVTLANTGPDRYEVVTLEGLADAVRPAEPDFCHAYYGHGEVIIPAIEEAGQLSARVLQQIPGETLQFSLLTELSLTQP